LYFTVSGDLFEIKEAKPYPCDYNAVVNQAKHEITNGFRPALKDKFPEISDYDLVILGSPNCWSTIAPPVANFLTQADFSDKTIATSITH
jgi:flavodoxin